MNDRERLVQELGDAAADCVQRLDRVKGWLTADATGAEAGAWAEARIACDRLYRIANKQQTSTEGTRQ